MSLQCTLLTTSSSTGRHQNPFLLVHHPLGPGISRSSHPSQKKFMCLHAQYMAQTTLPSRAGKSLGYPRFASGCPAAQASKYPDLSIRTSPGMLEDLITQKGQTHCQAMPKKQYVMQCNPQMFRNDFRSTCTYARLYPHYFCNPKLPASQQPGNA